MTLFRSTRTRALLAYLALENVRPLNRAHLGALLWDCCTPESMRTNLRSTLYSIRRCLHPFQLLHTTYQTVQFDTANPDFWCDALELERAVQGATWSGSRWLQNGGNATSLPTFLETFDIIDSAPFQAWLQQRRSYYQQLLAQLAQHGQNGNGQNGSHPGAAVITVGAWVAAASGPPAAEPLVQDEPPAPVALPAAHPEPLPRHEWGLIPDMGLFYGREQELEQLEQWVFDERCRLVAILGMGGQGKTALAAQFIRKVVAKPGAHWATGVRNSEFAHVLWSSLVNAPPLEEVLHNWLQTLTGQPASKLPTQLDQQLDRLVHELRRQRCLLVLDNAESIMATGERAGSYRPGYEAYGRLFQRLGESDHQSCLLLTSREQPREFALLGVGHWSVQTLRLDGLTVEAGQVMLDEIGLSGEPAVMTDLVQRYSGNPLALKLVAVTTLELFTGDIATFLTQETLVFDNIRDMLDQHFARLSATERDLLYWLAIEREPLPFADLYANLVQPPGRRHVLEALRSLQRRSLLEQVADRFYLQNVITEYLTDRLVAAMSREIEDFGF